MGHARRQLPHARQVLAQDERRLCLAQHPVLLGQGPLQPDDPLPRLEADPQLLQVEGLSHEVIGAGHHPLHDVLFLRKRGQEDGIHIAGLLAGPDAPDQL